jgi:hypothetical protein
MKKQDKLVLELANQLADTFYLALTANKKE